MQIGKAFKIDGNSVLVFSAKCCKIRSMKKHLFSFLLLILLFSPISAQERETEKVDKFGRIPCGEFMQRVDSLGSHIKNFSDSQIYVIYYGGRYRRNYIFDKHRIIQKIVLEYPHRDDGRNYAKSIPLYLKTLRNIQEDKIVLKDGGFREKTEVEIWVIPKNGKLPLPTPTIDEQYIKFRKDKPYGTPNYANCYG